MSLLTDRTALVTGATKGMGLAIAESLAHQGCNLLLLARDGQTLETLKDRLKETSPKIDVRCFACDVSDNDQLTQFIDCVERAYPHVDILVNNVGIFRPVSVLDESDEDFDLQMRINYYAPHRLSRAVGRHMRKNGKGHIFNIGSIASREPVSSAGSYTVTKYAMRGLTDVLREELRSYSVKVTEIVPGSTLTSSWEGTEIPAERFVLPADIANAIVACLHMSEGALVDEVIIKPQYGNH